MNQKNSLLILLLLTTLLVTTIPSLPPVQATEAEPTYFKGQNYETLTHPNGEVKWNSNSQSVWNGSHWVDYIYENHKAEGYYQVSVGLISARIYAYYAVFYAPENFSDVRVYDERWEVQKWKTTGKGGWDDLGAQSGTPTFRIVEYEDGVNITKKFHSWAGWLNITYVFNENLKHEITFTSEIGSTEVFRVLQQWAGIVGTKCKHENGTASITSATEVVGTYFEFFKSNGNLSVFENQWSAKEYLEPVSIDVHAKGMKCDFIFSNWTLTNGETLTIDPATQTLNDPTQDGYIRKYGASYSRYNSAVNITFGRWAGDQYGGYVQWNISSIPDTSTVTNVILKYHGSANPYPPDSHTRYIRQMANQPSTTSDSAVWYDTQDGTVYYSHSWYFPIVDTDQQVDLGANAATDVMNQFDDDWFAIGFATDDSFYHLSKIYSEDYGSATPTPTLEVTYTLASEMDIGEFAASSLFYANKWDFVNATIFDADTNITAGNIYFVNATIELSNSIILEWDNSTNTFSEYQDTNNYCILDASNSIRTTINDTSYKLSWKIQLAWSYPEGSVSILQSNTRVYNSTTYASGSHSNLFTFEDDLIVSVASVSPTTAEPTQTVTFSGTLYYEGTSTAPENTTDITAKVSLNADVKGTTTTIETDGSFSIGVVAPEDDGSFSYLIYALTDAGTVTNQTVQLTVEGGTSSPSSPGAPSGGVTIPAEPILPPQNVTLPPPYVPPAPTPTTPVELPIGIIIIVGTIVLAFGYKQFKRESRLIWPTQKRKSPTWNQKTSKNVTWNRKKRKNPKWERRKPLE